MKLNEGVTKKLWGHLIVNDIINETFHDIVILKGLVLHKYNSLIFQWSSKFQEIFAE